MIVSPLVLAPVILVLQAAPATVAPAPLSLEQNTALRCAAAFALTAEAQARGDAEAATVTPLAPYRAIPRLGQVNKPPTPGDRGALRLPLGRGLLGRVVDSHGHPMDHQGPIVDVDIEPLDRSPLNAMDRDPVRVPLDTGVRAINALLTVGSGQRIGLFAGSAHLFENLRHRGPSHTYVMELEIDVVDEAVNRRGFPLAANTSLLKRIDDRGHNSFESLFADAEH